MGNMGYCRFQITLDNLQDCYDHMEDDLGVEEETAKRKLIQLCRDIIDDYEE